MFGELPGGRTVIMYRLFFFSFFFSHAPPPRFLVLKLPTERTASILCYYNYAVRGKKTLWKSLVTVLELSIGLKYSSATLWLLKVILRRCMLATSTHSAFLLNLMNGILWRKLKAYCRSHKLSVLSLKDVNSHSLKMPLVNKSHDGVVPRHITGHLVTSVMQGCPLSSNHLCFS